MNLTKSVKVMMVLLGIVFVAFVLYGLSTDCPNTDGYFFCSDAEQRFLQQ